MEILGIGTHTNPRRNTSKEFFETLPRGDRADTCLRFVSSLSPLNRKNQGKVDTQWRQGGYMSPLSYYLSSINR